MPTSEGQILSTATAVDMHAFNSQLMASNHYSEPHLFAPQQSYAPSSFLHQDSGFEALEAANDDIPVHDMKIETGLRRDSGLVALPPGTFDATMAAPPKPCSEKLVFTASRSLPTVVADAEKMQITVPGHAERANGNDQTSG